MKYFQTLSNILMMEVLKILKELRQAILASACASSLIGTWTAIWSPSKSALNAAHTNGWSLIARPPINFGSNAWRPSLKMYECGIPKEMALELFKPHVINGLVTKEIASNIKAAKRMIENQDERVWDVVEEKIKHEISRLESMTSYSPDVNQLLYKFDDVQ